MSDWSLLCHLNRNDKLEFDREKNSKYLLSFFKKNKTIYLPEDDTIYVTEKETILIGHSSYRVYKNSKYKTAKVSNKNLVL